MDAGFGRKVWRAALAVVALAGALVFLCAARVLPWPARTFELQKIRASEGFGFTSKLPVLWPGLAFAQPSGVLTEDDREMTAANDNGPVRELGMGRFRVGGERVLFSSSDGSDPLKNGRRYALTIHMLVAPKVRPWLMLAGGIAALFLLWGNLPALRAARPATEVSARNLALVLFAGALAVRVGFLAWNPEYTDGAMSIRGSPFSDARDWNRMAKVAAEGRGVDATYPGIRAFYPIFLAHFYTWSGGSLMLAKGLQALIGAASAALVFLALRRALPRWAAFAAAVFFAVDPRQVTQAGTLMTEPFGLLLTLLSAWCLLVGGERRRPGLLFAAGVFFGCANLARPLTLFVLPIFCGLLAAKAWRRWQTALLHATAFALGAALCIGPWVVRERAVHGIWAISCNSASALFAASTPEFGTWGAGVESRSAEAGVRGVVKDRYDFYQAQFRENLKNYPGFYAGNVARSFRAAALGGGNLSLTLLRAWLGAWAIGCGIAMVRGGARSALALALPAFVATVALVNADAHFGQAFVLAGIAFALWWRWFPAAVLVVCHAGALLGSALFGNPDFQRLRLLIDWLEVGWMFAGVLAIGSVACALLLRIPVGVSWARDLADENAPRWLRGIGWAFAAFLLVSTGRLVFLNCLAPPAPVQPVALSDAQRTAFLEQFAAGEPAWRRLGDPAFMAGSAEWQRRVFVDFVSIEKEAHHFPAGVGTPHWSGHFAARPYEYTAFMAGVVGRNLVPTIYAEIAGVIPPSLRETPCLLIGLVRFHPNQPAYLQHSVEAAAIVPAPGWEPDMARALIAPLSPDTQALLDAPATPPQ